MPDPLFRAEGKTGILEIYPKRVKIRRDKLRSRLQHGSGREREIRLEKIAGVELDRGSIEFDVIGSDDDGDGIVKASSNDEILFSVLSHDPDEWERAAEIIREQQEKLDGGDDNDAEGKPPEDILKERFARGEIDEAEYHERLEVLNDTEGP